MPFIRPSKNTHTHAHTPSLFKGTPQHNQPAQSRATTCILPLSRVCTRAQMCNTRRKPAMLLRCVHVPTLVCTTSTHKKVHSRPFIAHTHHTQITPQAPRATHSALPAGERVPWTGEERRFGRRHTSAGAWPTQHSPRSLWMV